MIRVCILHHGEKAVTRSIIISFEATIGVIFVPVAAYIQSSNVAANITEDHKNISSG